MSRYEIKQRIMDKGWVIWDSVLQKFLGNGKDEMLNVDTHVQAQNIVSIMVQRVGA